MTAQVPEENVRSSGCPAAPDRRERRLIARSGPGVGYQVDVLDSFESLWLPTAQNITEINAGGRLALRHRHHGLPGR